MPGFNRRGPEGKGPMTGGGRGLCSPASRTFNRESTGRGRREGGGMGRRSGFGFSGAQYYGKPREESLLKNEEAMLRDELASIKERLEEIKETA